MAFNKLEEKENLYTARDNRESQVSSICQRSPQHFYLVILLMSIYQFRKLASMQGESVQ